MQASGNSVTTGPIPGNVIAQYFGIFHGISKEGFKQIVETAPFGACNLLILAFVHSVEGPSGIYTAQFNNRRDNRFPDGVPPDTDLERVALVVSQARTQNPAIRVLISLGYDDGDLANAAKTPAQFADSVAKLVQNHALDGFDIDYENADGVSADQLVNLVGALKQSLGKVSPKRDMILTITPATSVSLDKGVLESFTYVMPQYYKVLGGVPSKENDWYANQLGSFDSIVYGLSSEAGDDPVSYAIAARSNGAAGLFAWRLDTDDAFVGGIKMRRLMSDDHLWSAIHKTDGSWQWSGPIDKMPMPGVVDVSCARVGNGLQVVAVGTDFRLWHTIGFADGTWQPFYDVGRFVSGGPTCFSSVSCGSVDQKSLQVLGLGSDEQLWLAIHNPDGSWQSNFFPVKGIGDLFTSVGCAGTEQGLQVIAINDSAKRLWHAIWHPNGTWEPFQLVDLGGGPQRFLYVGCAGTPQGLHVVTVGLDQQLWHRIRTADGTWGNFRLVKDLAAGGPLEVLYASCASTQQGLQVIAAGNDYSLWHTVRNVDGTWQPFKGGVGPAAPPIFVSLACGSLDGQSLRVVGVGGA